MRIRIHSKLYFDTALFLILFLSGSFVVTNDIISSTATIALWLLVLLFVILQLKAVQMNTLVPLAVLIISLWLSTIINGEDVRRNLLITVSLVIVCFYVNIEGFDAFRDRYINIMYFLALVSLVGYILCQIFPALQNINLVENAAGNWVSNWWIFAKQPHISRNQGMYWEPGAFQTFLNVALLLELSKGRVKLGRVLLVIVTIVTTFSTTGLLGASLILLSYALYAYQEKKKKIFLLALVLLGLVIYAASNFDVLFSTSSNTPFGKIIRFFQEKEYEGSKTTSATVRYFAVVKVAQAFLESPIWGWGYQGLNEKLYVFTHNMNTCTFINWYAAYGIGYGIVMSCGMLGLARKLASNRTHAVLNIIILFVLTMSENYVSNAAITMLALYGLKKEKEGIHEDPGIKQLQFWQYG